MRFPYYPLCVFLFILTLVNIQNSSAQQKYRVYFTDKNDEVFNPYEYFDPLAIERRLQCGISLDDQTDYPVSNQYIKAISQIVDSTSFASRWFNFISVYISSKDQLDKLSVLKFVKKIEQVPLVNFVLTGIADNDKEDDEKIFRLLDMQTKRMGGNLFKDQKIDGKGIRIAIFDGGFPYTDKSPAFEQIRKEERIIKTWDFTKNKENVYNGVSHGSMVMACIGGIYENYNIGMATGAEFLLAKTEIRSEPFSEEENWLAAVEWADKNGAKIINSSLGYTYHRYFNYQMDGKTSLVVRAANLAARKGMLVINAAGNEGDTKWEYIGTPADADSIISVGGIDPSSDYHIGFSSYGPTVDKRMKPNVSAYGHVVTIKKNGIGTADGTSFASPLTAGFAACAWQLNPNLTNMEMFREIEKSGHLYPYFDYAHGYGIPQASYFLEKNKPEPKRTFDFIVTDSILSVIVKPDIFNNTELLTGNDILYYHIRGNDGVLRKYFVIKVEEKEAVRINSSEFSTGDKLVVHFRDFTDAFIF
jgi:serine protease AprX